MTQQLDHHLCALESDSFTEIIQSPGEGPGRIGSWEMRWKRTPSKRFPSRSGDRGHDCQLQPESFQDDGVKLGLCTTWIKNTEVCRKPALSFLKTVGTRRTNSELLVFKVLCLPSAWH